MKNLKKLNRRNLEQINGGAGPKSCNECPQGSNFTCDEYWALSEFCRNCVLINSECYVPGPNDL